MFQVLNALQGNVFPGTPYHWWGGKQDLEWAPLARQEGIGKSSYFVPGQLWPNNTYNTSNLGNNINKLRLEINYQARFSSERAAAWLLFDLQAEMTDAARCYLYVPALVTQSILAESIQERRPSPSAAACRRAQRIAALTDQHPGPQQPRWAHGSHHGATSCSPMHLAPYRTGALIHHQAIRRDIRSFPRKNITNWDWFLLF